MIKSILFSLAFIGFILLKHSKDYLGSEPEYLHCGKILVSSSGVSLLFTFISGIFISLLSYFLFKYLHKKLMKNFIEEHPFEKIIFTCTPRVIAISFTQFFVTGSFFGFCILPFVFFDEISHIDMITKDNFMFWIFLGIFIFITLLYRQTYTIILTDEKIIAIALNAEDKHLEIYYKEIEEIQKSFGGYNIISKNNNAIMLKCDPCVKKCYKVLRKILEKRLQ